jgi:hypothetical protein
MDDGPERRECSYAWHCRVSVIIYAFAMGQLQGGWWEAMGQQPVLIDPSRAAAHTGRSLEARWIVFWRSGG